MNNSIGFVHYPDDITPHVSGWNFEEVLFNL